MDGRKIHMVSIMVSIAFILFTVPAYAAVDTLVINSPFNTTYGTSTVAFNVTATGDVDSCWYDLDGIGNVTMPYSGSDDIYYAENATMTLSTHHVIFMCNDSGGAENMSETRHFTVNDGVPPVVTAYYQWDATNGTVDIGLWTEGFVSFNWNLTDVTGVNASTCQVRLRNRCTICNCTNLSYIDDLINPDYDSVGGYKNLTCTVTDLGAGVTRVSANLTGSYSWRPAIVPFDMVNAAQDNEFSNFGDRSTMIQLNNITCLINATFIFLADIDNQTATVADHLFYSCNESYKTDGFGDFTTSQYCTLVGTASPGAARDDLFGYLLGALTTDENASFGGVVHTSTMYGISYCPDCTNTNNAWLTYSTDGHDGHSYTSTTRGTHWSDLSGEDFNVILYAIDSTVLDLNLTIDDDLGYVLNDFRTDPYGPLPNAEPFGDIQEDNVTGGLVSYYDIHGVTETGTIWINVTALDPNDDTMNCSIYLLNNDSSPAATLLSNFSVDGFGVFYYEWDTTTVTDDDYRLNVTCFDGALTGYDTSAGHVRIDNTVPVLSAVTINGTPAQDEDTMFNVTVTESNLDTVTFELDQATNYTVTTYAGTEYWHVIASSAYDAGDVVYYRYYVNDTAGLVTASALYDMTINTRPLLTSSRFTDISFMPFTGNVAESYNNIYLHMNCVDYDAGAVLTAHWNITLDGVLVPGLSGSSFILNSTNVHIATIPAASTDPGDVWSASASCDDGLTNSTVSVTDSLTIYLPDAVLTHDKGYNAMSKVGGLMTGVIESTNLAVAMLVVLLLVGVALVIFK